MALYFEDTERWHTYREALLEYGGLLKAYSDLDYNPTLLPSVSVEERAEFVLSEVGLRSYARN